MFSEQDIKAEVRQTFRRMTPARRVAFNRGMFNSEVPVIAKPKAARFTLSDIINANSRITLERFKSSLPGDSPAGRIASARIAA